MLRSRCGWESAYSGDNGKVALRGTVDIGRLAVRARVEDTECIVGADGDQTTAIACIAQKGRTGSVCEIELIHESNIFHIYVDLRAGLALGAAAMLTDEYEEQSE